jgi:hypothetical protein
VVLATLSRRRRMKKLGRRTVGMDKTCVFVHNTSCEYCRAVANNIGGVYLQNFNFTGSGCSTRRMLAS